LGEPGPSFILKSVESIVFEGDMSEVVDHRLKVDGMFDKNEGYTRPSSNA